MSNKFASLKFADPWTKSSSCFADPDNIPFRQKQLAQCLTNSLGTIKASQIVVLNEDMLLLNNNSYK